MGTRHMFTLAEREEIALAHARGEGVRAIARLTGRAPSVISRELARNSSTRGYRATTAHTRKKALQTPCFVPSPMEAHLCAGIASRYSRRQGHR